LTAANSTQGSAAQRLSDLHRVSGALTHDFNNLLGVIISANERLAQELPEGSDQHRLALLALEAAERGAELLRRALAATHENVIAAPDVVDCGEALATLTRMARQAVDPEVSLKIRTPSQPLQAVADRTGLEMALLNLCLNASQAMPSGGRISVEGRQIDLNAADARQLGLRAGSYAALTVRDNGKGMSAETLARATQPLFTTKATGTGLGLSSVSDFATSAGGALVLRSQEGHGTTATLYLPLAARGAGAAAA